MSGARKVILFFLALGFFVAAAKGAVFAAEITWEVKHPFRFLRFESDFEIHKWAYEAVKTDSKDKAHYAPISNMERKLNDPRWWTKERQNDIAELRSEEKKADPSQQNKKIYIFNPREGWASLLRKTEKGSINGTCWNSEKQDHSLCDGRELLGTTGARQKYLTPDFHFVSARLEKGSPAQLCHWVAKKADNSDAYVILSPDKSDKKEYAELRDIACDQEVVLRVPFQNNTQSPVTLSVRGEGNLEVKTHIKVRDYLIIGLGDSFSSGEGNPEIIARIDPVKAIQVKGKRGVDLKKHQKIGLPRRSPAGSSSAAMWSDRRCHRSVYSYQTRTALQLALAPGKGGHHHHAITFLHYACSGAEITEDSFYGWEGRECITHAQKYKDSRKRKPWAYRHPHYAPQMTKTVSELCGVDNSKWERQNFRHLSIGKLHNKDHYVSNKKAIQHFNEDDLNAAFAHLYKGERAVQIYSKGCKSKRSSEFFRVPKLFSCKSVDRKREVDLVLTSVGGNDMGFSAVIADNIVNVGNYNKILRAGFQSLFVKKATAEKRLDHLTHRLKLYDKFLEKHLGLELRKVAKDKNGKKVRNVIAMLYPNMIFQNQADGKDRFCKKDSPIMDVSKAIRLDDKKLKDLDKLVDGADGLISAIKALGNWHYVDGYRKRFKQHGICAADKANSLDESGKDSAEIQAIPYKIINTNENWEERFSGDWKNFHPVSEYFPYESRKTWFRTPNQDYLNIQYYKKKMPSRWDWTETTNNLTLISRILGGAFHPTAEGHAHIADHIYCKAREVLYDETCDVQKVQKYSHKWGQ